MNPVLRSMAVESQLFKIMRAAFDQIVTRAPLEYSTLEMKAYLFQCILETAAERETRPEKLVASVTGQMQDVIEMMSARSELARRAGRDPSNRRRNTHGEV
jgi:hypothetical protein